MTIVSICTLSVRSDPILYLTEWYQKFPNGWSQNPWKYLLHLASNPRLYHNDTEYSEYSDLRKKENCLTLYSGYIQQHALLHWHNWKFYYNIYRMAIAYRSSFVIDLVHLHFWHSILNMIRECLAIIRRPCRLQLMLQVPVPLESASKYVMQPQIHQHRNFATHQGLEPPGALKPGLLNTCSAAITGLSNICAPCMLVSSN